MRAVIVDAPGGIEALQLRDIPKPEPKPDEVLIRICYASYNWADLQKRAGVYPVPQKFPLIPGAEVSGFVEAVGSEVSDFKEGDCISAITGPDENRGFAEYVCAPTSYVMHIPQELDIKVAAAFPTVCLTAYHLLHTSSQLKAGETLLIHAIGGSVGLMLTQIAVGIGAKVIGTVSSEGKGDPALKFGASRIVNRNMEDFVEVSLEETCGRGVDMVIDSLGADIMPRSFDALRYFGKLINIGEAVGYPDFDIRGKLYERSTSLICYEFLQARNLPDSWQAGIDFVIDGLIKGNLELPIAAVYPLAQFQEGTKALETRTLQGKLLFEVTPG